MKAIVFAITIFAIFGITLADFSNCIAYANYSAFNLCPFSKESVEFNITNHTKTLFFGLGSNHLKSCDGNSSIWARLTDPTPSCQNIAKKDPDFALLNPTKPGEGIKISFPVEKIEDKFYNLIINFRCNMDNTKIRETPFYLEQSSIAGNITYTLTGESRFACPALSFEQLINFIASNKYIFAAVFGAMGLVLTFFGLKFINFTIFSFTASAGTGLSGMFLYQFTDVTTSTWVFWALFAVCLILGVTLGYVALKLEKVAVFLVGAVLGFVGGELLYAAVIAPMLTVPANPNIFRGVIIVCVLLSGLLAFFLFELVAIIATSFTGSYLIVRVISTFAGHFPAEINVAQGVSQFDGYAYAYLGGLVVLALLGMRTQWVMKSKNVKEGEDLEENINPRIGGYGYAYYKY